MKIINIYIFIPILSLALTACSFEGGQFSSKNSLNETTLTPYTRENSAVHVKNSKLTFAESSTILVNEKSYFHSTTLEKCEQWDEHCEVENSFTYSSPKPGLFWAIGKKNNQEFSHPVSIVDPNESLPCLINPTFTKQGYSRTGGRNFYHTPYKEPLQLSIYRPIQSKNLKTHGHYFPLFELLQSLNIKTHVIDEQYIAENSNALNMCTSLIFSGHSEYWTIQMSDQVLSHIAKGKDILNISANIAYWLTDYDKKSGVISVDKYKKNLRSNRLKYLVPEVTTVFGGYYIGYPISRKLKNETEFKNKYPLIQNQKNKITYRDLRTMKVLDHNHPSFKCIKKGADLLSDYPLSSEVDGITLRQFSESSSEAITTNQLENIDGAILSAWSIYGKKISESVIGRDYINKYGGRVLQLGSIGWAEKMWNRPKILQLTKAAVSNFYDLDYTCD